MKANTKYILTLSIAFFLLLSLTFGMRYQLSNSASKLTDHIDYIEENIYNKNMEIAQTEIIKLNKAWDKTESLWSVLTNQSELDQISTSLKNSISFINSKDITNSLASLELLKYYIENVPKLEKLNLKNIL